jgi:hypothetical protein
VTTSSTTCAKATTATAPPSTNASP